MIPETESPGVGIIAKGPKPTTESSPASFAERALSHVDPKKLGIHPAVRSMPRLDDADPRYTAMQTAWAESMVINPLYVSGGEVVDGRHRLWFALAHNVATVPVIEVEEGEIPLVIMTGLIGRAHTTKSQRAYLAVPYLQGAFDCAMDRRQSLLKVGGVQEAVAPADTLDDLAARLGISRDLLYQARRVREAFGDPKVKEEYEPKILAAEDPISLAAVISGVAGGRAEKPVERNSALQKFTSSFRNLIGSCKGFGKLKAADKSAAGEALLEGFAAMPAEAVKLIADKASVALKRHAKAK